MTTVLVVFLLGIVCNRGYAYVFKIKDTLPVVLACGPVTETVAVYNGAEWFIIFSPCLALFLPVTESQRVSEAS
jgi:hypothetical protein